MERELVFKSFASMFINCVWLAAAAELVREQLLQAEQRMLLSWSTDWRQSALLYLTDHNAIG